MFSKSGNRTDAIAGMTRASAAADRFNLKLLALLHLNGLIVRDLLHKSGDRFAEGARDYGAGYLLILNRIMKPRRDH